MGAALPDYVRSVVKADLEEKGDEDVFRKIRKDFAAAGRDRLPMPRSAP